MGHTGGPQRLDPRRVRGCHRITSGKISASKLGEGRTSAYIITAAEVERVKSVA